MKKEEGRGMRNMFRIDSRGGKPGLLSRWTNIMLVGIFIAAIFLIALASLGYRFDWSVIWIYRIKMLRGYGMTFLLAFFAIIISIFIGAAGAAALQSRILFFRYLSRAYVEG
ncbi:MAG: hypothetical protein R6W99_09140, partial [Clostridia bacterium]